MGSNPPSDDELEGDGPFAVPLDAPRPSRGPTNDLSLIVGGGPDSSPWREETAPIVQAYEARDAKSFTEEQPVTAPIPRPTEPDLQRVQADTPFAAPRARGGSTAGRRVAPPREASRSRALAGPVKREYPLMCALIKDPGQIPAIEERAEAAAAIERGEPDPRYAKNPMSRSEPLPQSFIRNSPRPQRREASSARPGDPRQHLDGMLEQMAEGLLVGGSSDQHEMRVTLRDEFFRGTELQIMIAAEGVVARFVPPDRDTYRHLSSELHRLRAQLEERGLRVARLVVEEP